MRTVTFWLLWLFVFSIPWEKVVLIPSVGTGTRVIGIAALVSGVLALAQQRSVRVPTRHHLLLALFVAWAFLTCFWTVGRELTLQRMATYAQLITLTMLIWEFGSRHGDVRRLMFAFVLGTYVSSVDTLCRFVADEQTYYQRFAATGFNPNDLGIVMALSLPLSFYLCATSTGLMVWCYRVQGILAVSTICLSASRTAFVAAVVCLVLIPLFSRPRIRKIAVHSLIATAVVVIVWLFAPEYSLLRLGTVGDELTHGTINTRTEIWRAGVDTWSHNPWVGIGTGAFEVAVAPLFGPPDGDSHFVAHNTFLSVLAECGIVGLFFFMSALLSLICAVWSFPRRQRWLWMATLVVWGVSVSMGTWEDRKPTWLLFALIIAQQKELSLSQASAEPGPVTGASKHAAFYPK